MFSWVYSKFHYSPLKDENASRKNTEFIKKEEKAKGLAKKVNEMVDTNFDDWKINNDRRITILLMGFEKSSNPSNYKFEYFNLKYQKGKKLLDEIIADEYVDDGEDDTWPLMATAFLNNFDDNAQFEKSQVVGAIGRHVAQTFRRRVTLADLLMADDADVSNFQAKLPEVVTADGSCLAKKVKVAAEPPAINLRRLMKKMRKRKVHAEVDHHQLLGQKPINHHTFCENN